MTEEDSQKCSYCRKTKLMENFSLDKKGKYCGQKYKCKEYRIQILIM